MARAQPSQEFEALPEADRLEGFPHPRETQVLIGHEDAERTLATAFAAGRMHHAWMLAGPAGIGKATLAYRFARYVLARPDERRAAEATLGVPAQSSAARQVTALSHAGLLVLRRPYDAKTKRLATSIPVDEVRRLKMFLGLTSGDEAWRVVIVDAADELNLNAANALLKSLEEPPRRSLFLLVASQPSSLLPTIRSRCRRLDLAPLAPEPLRMAAEAALTAADIPLPTPEQWRELVRLSGGSVRRVLQLAATGGLELHQRIEKLLAALPRMDWTGVHALADTLAGSAQEQRFEAFFTLLLDSVARLGRVRVTGQANPAELAEAARIIPEDRLPQWAAAWEAILRDKADADELNLDRKALILRAFARLETASRI